MDREPASEGGAVPSGSRLWTFSHGHILSDGQVFMKEEEDSDVERREEVILGHV